MYKLFSMALLLLTAMANAQDFAQWKQHNLVLDNGLIRREIVVEDNMLYTKRLTLAGQDLSYDDSTAAEFAVSIDGNQYDGKSVWTFIRFDSASDTRKGKGATIVLEGTKLLAGVRLELTYLLYPNLPVIRKKITFSNHSGKEIRIASLDVEKIIIGFSFIEAVAYVNYGRQKHLGTYVGDWDDPLIAIHSYSQNAGILLGNESPGVLKRTAYNTTYNNADIGLTHNEDNYPFRKYLRNGESWTSPQVFIIPYAQAADPWPVMNTALADFTRRHMGLRINEIPQRPTIMYNNYVPFDDHFNDTLLLQLSRTAAEVGIKQFEIDCGWHTTEGNKGKPVSWIENTGDWIPDSLKFSKGLKPVFDSIRQRGMEPGLWISVGSASKTSKVFREHPEWAARDEKGQPVNLHTTDGIDLNTMCFGTDWSDYIKNKILDLVHGVGLGFVKLDLSVATSAYITDFKRSGCYATNHPYHKDREASLIVIYERLFKLFDELHAAAPNLFIDCTFETAGKLQLIDYAFCQHAEGNWLTNVSEPFPVGAFRIRNLAWWKSPALPASAFLIGNLQMDSKDFIQELKTLIGSFPIVLGDLRKLTESRKREIRQWTAWMIRMKLRYNYDLYRQDLPSFGEPAEGSWDAWARINTDTRKGGIIGVFRQGSLDDQRTLVVPGLLKKSQYLVKLAPTGQTIARMTGRELEAIGFKAKLTKKYDSQLFEIQLINP